MELVIVIAILAILLTMMIGNINPLVMINRGYDARRKKDMARLKVAFEEYFNDKGCYPTQDFINTLTCGSTGFSPWMSTWPCDPSGVVYKMVMDSSTSCPHWFKLMTNLQDRKDKDIPTNWYNWKYPDVVRIADGTVKATDVNYGVSSTNVMWYDFVLPPECSTQFKQCYVQPGPGRCNALPLGSNHYDVYVQQDCLPQCQVSCCRDGVVCGW